MQHSFTAHRYVRDGIHRYDYFAVLSAGVKWAIERESIGFDVSIRYRYDSMFRYDIDKTKKQIDMHDSNIRYPISD